MEKNLDILIKTSVNKFEEEKPKVTRCSLDSTVDINKAVEYLPKGYNYEILSFIENADNFLLAATTRVELQDSTAREWVDDWVQEYQEISKCTITPKNKKNKTGGYAIRDYYK